MQRSAKSKREVVPKRDEGRDVGQISCMVI